MRLRIISCALLIEAMSAFVIAPARSAVARKSVDGPTPFRDIPLTGTLEDATLTIDSIAVEHGQVLAL